MSIKADVVFDRTEQIVIELLSQATFGGSSASGDVDIDVAHDRLGIPYLPGTTLKRLLGSAWKDMERNFPDLGEAGRQVFGVEGESTTVKTGMFSVGDATVEEEAVAWLRWCQANGTIDPVETFHLFTVERTQTAIDTTTGAPMKGSLRRRRAVRRSTVFHAIANWDQTPQPQHRRVLAMAALATRHGGTARNRGAGHLRVRLGAGVAQTRKIAEVEQ